MKTGILYHLQHDYLEPVRDPLWGHIYLTPALKKIIQTREFLRLSRLRQLGPASIIYPGAVHTRFNHSLGVFYLSKKILENLLVWEDCPDLTLEGAKAFLCASLLHDVGHFPHAHVIGDMKLLDHEILSGRTITDSIIGRIIQNDVGCDPEKTAAIIDQSRDANGDYEVLFFRKILSGVLDPDKMDYLNRDAYFCGVPYGVQDTDFVISQIRPHDGGIGLPVKGVTAVENLLFSKYLMYKTVYWHPSVRISTGLVRKAVQLALNEGWIRPADMYKLDDEQFLSEYGIDGHPILELILDAETPGKFSIVLQEQFDPGIERHARLVDNAVRGELEVELARFVSRKTGVECPVEKVIVDIPANVSFEVSLPILTEKGAVPFVASGTVFDGPVVKGFTDTLRKIRYIVPVECDVPSSVMKDFVINGLK